MRMSTSSGKSRTSRREICSGLQAVAQRRSARCGLFSPFHVVGGAGNDGAVATLPLPPQPALYVLLQPRIARQLRRLGTPRRGLRLPLRDAGPVLALAAAGRGVAPQ